MMATAYGIKQGAAERKSEFGSPRWLETNLGCTIQHSCYCFLAALHLSCHAYGLCLMMAGADGIKQGAAERKLVFGFCQWSG